MHLLKSRDIFDSPTPPRQIAALSITLFFPTLALITFVARIWSRLRITRCWALDDWLMVPAAMCSIFLTPLFFLYMKLGYFGWRQQDVPADYDPTRGLFLFYIAQVFYNPILALVKCSVLVFVLRIGRRRPGLPWMVYSVITLTVLQAIAVFFGVVFQCLPIATNWDPSLRPTAKCIDVSFHVTISSFTVLTDLLVLALPFYVFLGLQIGRGTKVAVLCCFASGAVVTAVSIARIESLVRLFYYPPTDPFHDIKITYSIVEPNLAIATACAPALRPLLKHYFPSVFGKLSSADMYGNCTSHTRDKNSHGKMSFAMEPFPYSQKEFRRVGHAELASIASSQEEMTPKMKDGQGYHEP